MGKLKSPFRPKKHHYYFGFHGLTLGCWWAFLSVAFNAATIFVPQTPQAAILSIGVSVGIIYLSHKFGKRCKWI